jgi:hypothetical protein
MPDCSEMKNGDIYVCEDCGLELLIIKECKDAEATTEGCSCETDDSSCKFFCCGSELVKKES